MDSGTKRRLTRKERALRLRVEETLRNQGFQVDSHAIRANISSSDKEGIRRLHQLAVSASRERARPGLERLEGQLIARFARGDEVEPEKVQPVLHEVKAGTEEELLFRYARLHWSIPVSAGYGRRLRFLVLDENTNKLMGLIGLGDPVFRLGPRDRWIGWNSDARAERLRYVMDAFVLGAVPPYSSLLCGKLVALLVGTDEVQRAFSRKYRGASSVIRSRRFDGRLALITTTSALGRSSIYNRLRLEDRKVYLSAGYTTGSGEFQFSNGIYKELLSFAEDQCTPAAKNANWGSGWRNRREVVRAVLPRLGLSRNLVYHGVEREVFVVPLARNTREFLRGEHKNLRHSKNSVRDVSSWFQKRWLLPRARRAEAFRDFDPESLRLWSRT